MEKENIQNKIMQEAIINRLFYYKNILFKLLIFKSNYSRMSKVKIKIVYATVAQLVEQQIRNL